MPSKLHDKILANFESLSPKQRQLARYLLENEGAAVFHSAADIAEEVGTSSATVVRFARSLGYEGYADLQEAVRSSFRPYRTVAAKMAEQVAGGQPAEEPGARLARLSARNVRRTMERLTGEQVAGAVDAMLNAEEILIFASGLSAPTALLMEHHLAMLGLPARAFLNEGVDQVLHLSQLTPQDLVIVISVWRYIRRTVEAAEAAREAGATCMAITDSPVSAVAGLADYVLVADTEGAGHSLSLSGIVALIELLSMKVAERRPEASMAAVERIEELYRSNGMLLEE